VSRLNISVVIPAYNAEKYLETAIKSAVDFSDVQEVIIVDDGSQDGTLELSLNLKEKNHKIKVYQHPKKENKGVSASRNLGINLATGDYIAFLDADDFYLPNRFDAENTIFNERPDVEGVYGAIGAHFITDLGKARVLDSKMMELTTISGSPAPEELLYVLLGVNEKCHGHFHLDALTVHKTVFAKSGFFDEDLDFAEDTDLITRLAATCNLVAGMLDRPIAMRGVHDTNRVTNNKKLHRSWAVAYDKLYTWGKDNGMPERALSQCLRKALIRRTWNQNFFQGLRFLLHLKKDHPELRSDTAAYRKIVFGVFGDNIIGKIYIKLSNVIGFV
jgi:glycosyltransferase involved in cell wall biosynthesis